MGKLERAKIIVLADDGTKDDPDKDADSTIDVCFNPKEYQLDKTVQWKAEKAQTDAPLPEFTEPQPLELSVTLQFDTYEERVSVRDKYTKKIEKLTMMRAALGAKPTPADKKKAMPPVCIFLWGRFTFKGVLESVSTKYTMFLADGTPVRAECAIKMRNVDRTNHGGLGDDDQFSVGQAQEKSYTVQDGDRLDTIAAKQMGSAGRWAELAALNNIDDPSNVPTGTNLKIPG
jgi:hypothetical protein